MFLKNLYHYYLIKRSGLFDHKFYIQSYPDVRKEDIDPIMHYIKIGWKECRNPSEKFNTSDYLKYNTDVREKMINPLVHYIKHGKHEGRLKTSQKGLFSQQVQSTETEKFFKNPLAEKLDNEFQDSLHSEPIFSFTKKSRAYRAKTDVKSCTAKQLSDNINKRVKFDKYELCLSHDDYLQEAGGVQITISDHEINNKRNGIGYFHIYPYHSALSNYHSSEPFFVKMNLDGQALGSIAGDQFIIALQKSDISLNRISIQHTMGFCFNFIFEVLNKLKFEKIDFWLHDFYSICPNYFLLRNDVEFCYAPNVESNACKICIYGTLRKKQQREFVRLFNEYNIKIIAPSEFAYNFWREKTEYTVKTYEVRPHATINWKKRIPINLDRKNRQLKIAFVGYPVFHKGWDVYKKLTDDHIDNPNFKFYLFSNHKTIGNFECVQVYVKNTDRLGMVEKLKQYQIDVAILWSLCPETFSYTLHESLAAGCFVITNKYSGNIQAFISEHPDKGIILENEQSLTNLFSSDKLVKKVKLFQEAGRPNGDLVFPNRSIY